MKQTETTGLTGVLATDGGLVAESVHEGAAVSGAPGRVKVDGEAVHRGAETVVVLELRGERGAGEEEGETDRL